jgi:pyrroloquinoline quinone biosynthesis protein B
MRIPTRAPVAGFLRAGRDEPHLQPLGEADAIMVDDLLTMKWRLGISEAREIDTCRSPGRRHDQRAQRSGPQNPVHINNTNPILDEDSPERAQLAQAGIEVAYDGMDIEL